MCATSFASLLEEMAYRTYCVGYPAEARAPWCHKRVPSLYSYVQAQYWDVGFLRFYHKLARVRGTGGTGIGVGSVESSWRFDGIG